MSSVLYLILIQNKELYNLREKLTVTWLKTDSFSYPLFFILLSFRVTYYFVTIDIGVGFDFEICSTMQRAQNFTKYYFLTLPSAFAEEGSRH